MSEHFQLLQKLKIRLQNDPDKGFKIDLRLSRHDDASPYMSAPASRKHFVVPAGVWTLLVGGSLFSGLRRVGMKDSRKIRDVRLPGSVSQKGRGEI